MNYQRSTTLPAEGVQVFLTGRDVDRLVKGTNSTGRALFAADLEGGRFLIEKLTARQARALAQASTFYQYAARKLSPLERDAIRSGRLKLSAVAHQRRHLNDTKLDRLVAAIGPDRILSALDRLTRPAAIAAE